MDKAKSKVNIYRKIIFIILIIALGFGTYANSLNGGFLYDDIYLIKYNAYIKPPVNIVGIFSRNIGAGSGVDYYFYRPLQIFTYALDYSVWKLNPVGYHLTNILIHILVALCIYWLINILFASDILSLLTSLLFVIHPINTEAVSYISGRADPLAALFILLSLILYIKGATSTKSYLSSCVLFILAILSKEGALILIPLLLWYGYAFNNKISLKRIIPFLVIAAIYIISRVIVYKNIVSPFIYPTTFFQRLPGVFVSLVKYIKLLFLPFNLHMEHGLRFFSLLDVRAILGVLVFIFCFIYLFKHRATKGLFFFSIGWFFITLFPVSNIFPINAYMAEHWLYLPAIGFFLVVAKGLDSLYKLKNSRIISVIIFLGLLIFYSTLTIKQNTYWNNPLVFYAKTLEYTPDSQRMYFNLGEFYKDSGNKEGAFRAFIRAIELDPAYFEACYSLGNLYNDVNDKESAIRLFKKAAEIRPTSPDVFYNLGNIYYSLGKKEDAATLFKKVIALDPKYASAYNNLGNIYYDLGDTKEAIRLYNEAISTDSSYAKAYNNLGRVYISLGKKDDAIELFKKAIAINPNYAIAHNNLAVLYYEKGDYALALKHCELAIKLGAQVNPELIKAIKGHSLRKSY